jgi:hypothetical protein
MWKVASILAMVLIMTIKHLKGGSPSLRFGYFESPTTNVSYCPHTSFASCCRKMMSTNVPVGLWAFVSTARNQNSGCVYLKAASCY